MAMHKALGTFLIALLGFLPPASWGQAEPPDVPEDELIVRLRPFPGAPRPAEVVEAVNQQRHVPGGLGIGNPHRAEFLLPARLEGRMKDFYDENPDFPRARLERSVVLHYPTPQAAHGILTALGQNPTVEFVEINRPLYLPTDPQEPPVPAARPFRPPGRATLEECPPALGVIPNDPLFAPPAGDCDPTKFQWGSYAMRLPEAWQYVRGHAKVLVVDTGLQTDHPDLKPFGWAGMFPDWFIRGNFRPHLSYNYAAQHCDVGAWFHTPPVHGSHTSGILAATPNNGIGVAGACWGCPLVMASFNGPGDAQTTMSRAARSLTEGADKGVQVGSMSFGTPEECPTENWGSSALCEALDNYTNREIVFTAASGNDLMEVELPAIHPDVAAIGAVATDGTHWERLTCPNPGELQSECGSNYSQDPDVATLDLVAPGQFVLSTVFTGEGYPNPPYPYPDTGCGDQFPNDGDGGNDSDGYGSCTGTSMASPYVAGVLALLRTANPLLTRWQLRQVVTETATRGGAWDQKLGHGVPDAAAAVERVQGRVGGQVLINRATPMFRLYSATHQTHLFTTSPQAAVSEIEGVGNRGFFSDPIAGPIGGYPFLPGDTKPEARASFWLFTGPVAADGSGQALIPLYRLTRDRAEAFPFCGDDVSQTKRSSGYTGSEAEIRTFHTASLFNDGVRYFPEGIEGYLYPPAASPPVGAEKLFRYYDDVGDDWLLLLESEEAPPGYDDTILSSGGAPDGQWLGWVLPNVDSDGDWVIDAWEELLGTDPQVADTDGDHCSDGDEILGYGHPSLSELSDPLDRFSFLQLGIFADGFESGDVSAWDGSVP